ncbi:MAG: IclR family transcriptional regulator [Pseudarthrobacter sp.]
MPDVKDGMLGKGLNLLMALGEHPQGVGVSKLATQVGVPTSTAHRLLNSMVQSGFVTVDEEARQYSLGLRIFELSHQVSLVHTLSDVALPAMRRLTQVSGEQTLMAVRRDLELVYLEKVEGAHQLQNNAPIGARGPLHCSAMGKALLAWLPESEMEEAVGRLEPVRRTPHTITDRSRLLVDLRRARERGYAINEQENELGVRSVAAPILDPRGRPSCAICITAPVFRCSRETLDSHVPLLLELAREAEVRLPRGGAVRIGLGGRK